MERINSINTQKATGIMKALLDDVRKKRGMTSAMMRGMDQSSGLLKGGSILTVRWLVANSR